MKCINLKTNDFTNLLKYLKENINKSIEVKEVKPTSISLIINSTNNLNLNTYLDNLHVSLQHISYRKRGIKFKRDFEENINIYSLNKDNYVLKSYFVSLDSMILFTYKKDNSRIGYMLKIYDELDYLYHENTNWSEIEFDKKEYYFYDQYYQTYKISKALDFFKQCSKLDDNDYVFNFKEDSIQLITNYHEKYTNINLNLATIDNILIYSRNFKKIHKSTFLNSIYKKNF